jgi:hypothetical protein
MDDLDFITDPETREVAAAVTTWAAEVNKRMDALEKGRRRDQKRIKELEDRVSAFSSNVRRGIQ